MPVAKGTTMASYDFSGKVEDGSGKTMFSRVSGCATIKPGGKGWEGELRIESAERPSITMTRGWLVTDQGRGAWLTFGNVGADFVEFTGSGIPPFDVK
jgi:hypothetical protein